MMSALRLIMAFAVFIAAGAALAQSEVPSVQTMIEKLKPASEPSFRLGTRGIAVENAAPEPATPRSIDLTVNFEFGSAKLSTDAVIVLNNLGRALNDPALKAYTFMVGGHTDGVGSYQSNLKLSEIRARAVVDYLVRSYGIAPERLRATGFGYTKLLYKDDLKNPLNRRVQIANVGANS